MRTFENARLLRLNLCELNAMSDDDLAELIRINNPTQSVMNFSDHKGAAWSSADKVPSIFETASTASRCEKGVRPYSGVTQLLK